MIMMVLFKYGLGVFNNWIKRVRGTITENNKLIISKLEENKLVDITIELEEYILNIRASVVIIHDDKEYN